MVTFAWWPLVKQHTRYISCTSSVSSCSFNTVTVLVLVVVVTSLSAAVPALLGPATVSHPAWTALVFHPTLSLQVNSKVQLICSVRLSGPGLQWCSGSSRRPFSLCPNSQLLLDLPVLFQCFLGSRLLSSCLLTLHFCQCFIKLPGPNPNAERKRITDSYRLSIKSFLYWKTCGLAEKVEFKSLIKHHWFC